MKVIAFILSVIVLTCTIIPCSVFDNCEEETHATGTPAEEDKDCEGCSPFSICAAAQQLFTVTNMHSELVPAVVNLPARYTAPAFGYHSDYYSSLFQPPRNC